MITTTLGTLLMGFAVLTGAVDNPPEDFLSLGNTEKILTSLNAGKTEEELVNILGGAVSEEKLDITKLEAAVKLLREGNSTERREAKEILNSAGREALPFFKNLAKDSDPEVSETAKNIIKKNNVAKKKAAELGVTPEILKLLAIRRLTQLKATSALSAIKELTTSENADIAREAKRAVSVLEGKKPKRMKRGEAAAKALELIPEDSGFAAILDMTEPEKSMSLKDYLKDFEKIQIPGMNLDMITGEMNKVMPELLTLIGNPQVDAASMAVAEDIGDNKGWVGWVFIGSYDLKKMKKTLAMELEPTEVSGHKFFADKWGPSIYPVDEHTLIMTVGPSDVKHMEPFLKKLSSKKIPEKFADLKDTSKIRLMAMGDFSDDFRKLMKDELGRELQRMQNRNRQGPESEAEKALMELGIIFAETSKMKAVYDKGIITFAGQMPDDAKAKKIIATLENADVKIRKMFDTVGGGMLAQFVDTKKSFAKGSADGKAINVKIRGDLFGSSMMFPFFMMANMRMQVEPVRPRARIRGRAAEVQVIDAEEAIERVVEEAAQEADKAKEETKKEPKKGKIEAEKKEK